MRRGSGTAVALGAIMLAIALGAHSEVARPAAATAAVQVRPNGDDATCARLRSDRPCRTLDRAYAVARLGDIVEVGGGTYPAQRITQKADKSASGDLPDVVMRPVPGHRVRLAKLQLGDGDAPVGPDHLTLEGFEDWEDPATQGTAETCEWSMRNGTTDVTWRGLRACNWYLIGVRDVTIVGGVWGPCTTDGSDSNPCANNKIDFQPPRPSRDVVIDGGLYHDYRIIRGSGAHFECMFIVGGWNVTVRRARFHNCSIFDIFVQYYQDLNFPKLEGTPYNGLTFENNFFAPPIDIENNQVVPTALFFSNLPQSLGYEYRNVLVRFNSFYKSWVSFNDGRDSYDQFRYHNVRLVGNIMQRTWQDCGPITHAYNVYVRAGDSQRTGCSKTDRFVDRYPYVNADAGNYHVVTSAAVDRVPAEQRGELAPRRDIDGNRRPMGRGRDAGADECVPPRPKKTKKGTSKPAGCAR